MTGLRENGLTRKEQLFSTLCREIFAAEMKVALDKELGRETSRAVKTLAGMKPPPVARANEPFTEGTVQGTSPLMSTEELLRTLRREIFAAEMKVALDKELGRETSPTVKRLAGMKMPPLTNSRPEEVEPAGMKPRTRTRYVSARSGQFAAPAPRSAVSGKVVSAQQSRVSAT